MNTNTASLTTDFLAGRAITAGHAELLERDGIDHGRRILTAAEQAAVFAHTSTLPSTPGNNVWD